MGSPSEVLTSLRPDLAASVEEFDLLADRAGFIASRVMPAINVAHQAGTFGRIPLDQLLQKRNTERASGAPYSRSGFTFKKSAFATEEHGAEEVLDDRDAKMYQDYFDGEAISVARAADAVLRNREMRVAAAIFNASTWTGSALTTGITEEWDTPAAAIPLTDVHLASIAMWEGSGIWPNALIINRKVFKNLQQVAQIIARQSASGAGDRVRPDDLNVLALAKLFDLDQVIVAGSPKNTANEGQTAVIAPVWSDEYAMVCRVATSNDPREPAIARSFHWSEDGSTEGGTIETYRDESVRGQIIRVRHDVDEKIIYVQAGHLLSNVTTI